MNDDESVGVRNTSKFGNEKEGIYTVYIKKDPSDDLFVYYETRNDK